MENQAYTSDVVLTGTESNNKYDVKNTLEQQIYTATEKSGYCMRQCCGRGRGFIMHVVDNNKQCCTGCCILAGGSCCEVEMYVEAPVGQVVGRVKQTCSLCQPKFVVENTDGDAVFTIDGPACICQYMCCYGDVEFPISSLESGDTVGRMYQQRSDRFVVTFPRDLDVKMKALLFGAVFLIDVMYFKRKRDEANEGNDVPIVPS